MNERDIIDSKKEKKRKYISPLRLQKISKYNPFVLLIRFTMKKQGLLSLAFVLVKKEIPSLLT